MRRRAWAIPVPAGPGACGDEPANLYRKHPKGDTATTPCTQLRKEHPGGCPFWSHYDPVPHALVVTRDPEDYKPAGSDAPDFDMADWRTKRLGQKKDTLRHEPGHSMMKLKCVKIPAENGSHSMEKETDAGTAMSEGWANFVAAVLQNDRAADEAYRKGYEIENAARSTAPVNRKVEYRVTAVLWDLYDTHSGRSERRDTASIEF